MAVGVGPQDPAVPREGRSGAVYEVSGELVDLLARDVMPMVARGERLPHWVIISTQGLDRDK
jgi:hypothetical protein